MPPLTRWMLKTSLLYLLAAFVTGLVQALGPLLAPGGAPPALRVLEPVRLHLFTVGWLSLLIFGVVFWMFPKYSREKPRGHEWLGWVTYGSLNAGLLLRAVGEIAIQGRPGWGWLLVISAVLQWLAAAAFVLNTWTRVKEK